MYRPVLVVLVVLCVLSSICASYAKTIYVNSSSGLDTNTGLSWLTAMKSIPAAMSIAESGDDIWVARGEYTDKVDFKDGIALYGGFSGTEEDLSQRNWASNRSVLRNCSISLFMGYSVRNRIDGFEFRGILYPGSDSAGSGIGIWRGNVHISNNRFIGCRAGGGSPISASESMVQIINNTIQGNSAINKGGGIALNHSTGAIINNTIVSNSAQLGGAIYVLSGGPIIVANNLIAHNSSGIINSYQNAAVIIRNNCFYDNEDFNWIEAEPDATNITADPLLVSREFGDLHISPASPCRDAGDNGYVYAGSQDMDSTGRIFGGRVDIGADEYDGTEHTHTPRIIRVAEDADDSHDGSSWENSRGNLQEAINSAAETGGEVWIKTGTYTGNFYVPPYVYLYGGFSGSENDRSHTDPATYASVLDAIDLGTVLTLQSGHLITGVNGLTIRKGYNERSGAIFSNGGSHFITNNTITNNQSENVTVNLRDGSSRVSGNQLYDNSSWEGCIYLSGWGNPIVENNYIYNNHGTAIKRYSRFDDNDSIYNPGGVSISGNSIQHNTMGIYIDTVGNCTITDNEISGHYQSGINISRSQSTRISGNTIFDNHNEVSGGGITVYGTSDIHITDNSIISNTGSCGGGIGLFADTYEITGNDISYNYARSYAGGLYLMSGYSETDQFIIGNRITNNMTSGSTGGLLCSNTNNVVISGNLIARNTAFSVGGICCDLSDTTVSYNTIACNNAYTDKEAALMYGNGYYDFHSNIIAYNSGGIHAAAEHSQYIQNNCVFNPGGPDYIGFDPLYWDIRLDPLMVSPLTGDYHLTFASPCRDAGMSSAPSHDLDGDPRRVGYANDIGADEVLYADSIKSAKGMRNDLYAISEPSIVSAIFGDAFYIQNPYSYDAIRIENLFCPYDIGTQVSVTGKTDTSETGERCIRGEKLELR